MKCITRKIIPCPHTHILTSSHSICIGKNPTSFVILCCKNNALRQCFKWERKKRSKFNFLLVGGVAFLQFCGLHHFWSWKKPLKMKMANTLPIPIQSLLATDMAIKSQTHIFYGLLKQNLRHYRAYVWKSSRMPHTNTPRGFDKVFALFIWNVNECAFPSLKQTSKPLRNTMKIPSSNFKNITWVIHI